MKLLITCLLLGITVNVVLSKTIVKRDCCCEEYTSCSSSCSSPCNSGYSNNCNNRPCNNRQNCHQRNNNCNSNDDDEDNSVLPVLIPFPQTPEVVPNASNSINNTNINNGTLDLTISNTLNTVNNISVPIALNSTNENSIVIHFDRREETSPEIEEIAENCCNVITKSCDDDNKNCTISTKRECSDICTGILPEVISTPAPLVVNTPKPNTSVPKQQNSSVVYVGQLPNYLNYYPFTVIRTSPKFSLPVIQSPCSSSNLNYQQTGICSQSQPTIQQFPSRSTYPFIVTRPSYVLQNQPSCGQQPIQVYPTVLPALQQRPTYTYQQPGQAYPIVIPVPQQRPTGPYQNIYPSQPNWINCSVPNVGQVYLQPQSVQNQPIIIRQPNSQVFLQPSLHQRQPLFQRMIQNQPFIQETDPNQIILQQTYLQGLSQQGQNQEVPQQVQYQDLPQQVVPYQGLPQQIVSYQGLPQQVQIQELPQQAVSYQGLQQQFVPYQELAQQIVPYQGPAQQVISHQRLPQQGHIQEVLQ